MKPSFNIGAQNGLLEQKHMDRLGNAVWLYLWFLDKQPKDTDKVLGGQPITYQLFAKSFPDVPRQTYVRWLSDIKAGGYVEVIRTPRGLVITISKPKKWFNSDVSKMEHHKPNDVPKIRHQAKSDVSKMGSDVSKTIHPMPKNDTSNIKETKLQETIRNNRTRGAAAPEYFEEISKTYYQAIKALSLPVLNHNTLRVKIKAIATEDDPQKILRYLEFIRDQYAETDWDFKPSITNALEIYTKRLSIRTTLERAAKEEKENKVFRI